MRFILSIVAVFAVTPAFAQENPPPETATPRSDQQIMEAFYQPPRGKSAFTLGWSQFFDSSFEFKRKSTGAKAAEVKNSQQKGTLSVQSGITDTFSAGADISYTTSKTDIEISGSPTTSRKSTGMSDVAVNVLNRIELPRVNLYVGATASMSPEKGKDPTSTKEGNQYTGGWSVSPSIGFSVTLVPDLNFGAGASYAINGERTATDQGTPEKEKKIRGGNLALAYGYLEHRFGNAAIQLVGGFGREEATDTTTGATTSTVEESNLIALGAATYFYLSPLATLTLTYAYVQMPEHSANSTLTASTYQQPAVSASFRLVF